MVLSFAVFCRIVIVDQLILELITVVHSIGVCFGCVVHYICVTSTLMSMYSGLMTRVDLFSYISGCE